MYQSETLGLTVARPYDDVYGFLLEPPNVARLAFAGDARIRNIADRDWAVEAPAGPHTIRVAARNAFGVLDYEVSGMGGDAPHPTGLRVVANGAGAELICTIFERPAADSAEWAAEQQKAKAGLQALRTRLEARGKVSPQQAARTVALSIERPPREVYGFLAEPLNFGKWAFTGDASMRHLGKRKWAVETSVGPRIIWFAERNQAGIADYRSAIGTGALNSVPMRVFGNGEGTELTYTFFKRPGTSDADWQSVMEWVNTDLFALKSMLDARGE